MVTFLVLTPVAPLSGWLPVIRGGVSSKAPPSGLPTAAQPDNAAKVIKANAALQNVRVI
jgi:hypothetical protein